LYFFSIQLTEGEPLECPPVGMRKQSSEIKARIFVKRKIFFWIQFEGILLKFYPAENFFNEENFSAYSVIG
jgi:hypothetical protein